MIGQYCQIRSGVLWFRMDGCFAELLTSSLQGGFLSVLGTAECLSSNEALWSHLIKRFTCSVLTDQTDLVSKPTLALFH